MKANKSRRLLTVFIRTLIVIGVTVAMLLVFLLGAMWIIARGPSPAAGRLFVLSVRETSAVGFLADIYFSKEEIASFYNNNEKSDEKTDTSLIQIPSDKNPSDTDNTQTQTPPGYETPPVASDSGIEIYDVKGPSYLGKMMVISDPSRVIVGVPDKFGDDSKGLSVNEMIKKYGAVAGINAGGFYDEGGSGTGGIPDGVVIVDGEALWGLNDTNAYNVVGFDADNILHVGRMTCRAALDAGITDAVSFGPSLIINGNPTNSGWKLGGGVNPRTAIGQRSDGAVLLLVINGRQIDSLGATYDDLIDIMLEYGAVNASNLDGGSSSLMIYNGEYITNSAYIFGERVIATSFLVMPEVK